VVDIDPRRLNPEPPQSVALRGEVLFFSRNAGVADEQSSHDDSNNEADLAHVVAASAAAPSRYQSRNAVIAPHR
jgi:hypothetical protein